MEQEDVRLSHELVEFVRASPTAYQAVDHMCRLLDGAGFVGLRESDPWRIERGGSYYTTRNGSSIVAFRVGERVDSPAFLVAASHGDSPMPKVKANAELAGPGSYLRLDVEMYGGSIDRSWLDRPLSLAGRVMVREDGRVKSRLVSFDRDLLLIPSVAIHLGREVNKQGGIDRRVDLMPLMSAGELGEGSLDELLAAELGVDARQILARDLFVVNRQPPVVWGDKREFVSAPRLDDLQCAFASLKAFVEARNERRTTVFACFDNEEVGSGTMQGALSTLLPDVLRRVSEAIEPGEEAYLRGVARSFMVSCDNAHAVHPNHPELHDEANRAWINEGVVVKEAANQRYTTDALSRAVFEEACKRAGVPVQRFANRSDMPGGSTLGNLATQQVSLHSVDVGLPQLAMHSAFETAGTRDTGYLVAALRAVFEGTEEISE